MSAQSTAAVDAIRELTAKCARQQVLLEHCREVLLHVTSFVSQQNYSNVMPQLNPLLVMLAAEALIEPSIGTHTADDTIGHKKAPEPISAEGITKLQQAHKMARITAALALAEARQFSDDFRCTNPLPQQAVEDVELELTRRRDALRVLATVFDFDEDIVCMSLRAEALVSPAHIGL